MDEQYGPLGNNVNVCSNCVCRAFSERFASGVYSAAGAATEATIIHEDDYRPPFPVGGSVSDSFADNNSGKDLHTRGVHLASASSVASMNDYGHHGDENIQNHSSPIKQQSIGSKRKGSPASSSPLSPHNTSCGLTSSPRTPQRPSGGLKPSLLTSPPHTSSASLSCALALSSPTRADTRPTKKQCQGVYSGSSRKVLHEVAKMMENNAQRLRSIAESEDPITCFAKSDIGTIFFQRNVPACQGSLSKYEHGG